VDTNLNPTQDDGELHPNTWWHGSGWWVPRDWTVAIATACRHAQGVTGAAAATVKNAVAPTRRWCY